MNEFFRSFEQLRRDNGSVPRIIFGVVAVLVAGLGIWLFHARVVVYVATDAARLEAVTRICPLDTAVSGRVKATRLKLGEYVRSGEMLVELDARGLQRQLDEDRTHLAALGPELTRLSAAIDAEQQALASAHGTAALTLDEARVRAEGAEAESRTAREIADRYEAVRGVTAYIDVLRVEADAHAKATAARNLQLEVPRLQRDLKTQEGDREASIQQLNRDRIRLQGEIETTKAELKRLEYEITKESIRAPINGRVASVSDLEVGAFVRQGERLGTIVPTVKVRGVAEFSALTALGRIHSGQPAWLHLSGFPWMQFGSISGTVAGVAAEPSEGQIRVELDVDSASAPLIPIEHGLPGTAEIAVERVAPITLLLRAAGQLMVRPASPRQL